MNYIKCMINIGKSIKTQRTAKNWSQAHLAHESRCSLATIQNIEAGRANPEIETLARVLSSLGQKLSIISKSLDFTFWPSLGLPMLDKENILVTPSKELLLQQLKIIEPQLHLLKDERLCTALASFLSALKGHFPTSYSQTGISIKEWLEKHENTFCRPKLRRLSIERLATYL